MRTSSCADSRQLVTLRPMSTADRDAVLAGNDLPGITTAPDYPTEFSQGMAPMVGTGSPLGLFLVLRSDDDVVVGDIGGGFTAPGEAEIGTPSPAPAGDVTTPAQPSPPLSNAPARPPRSRSSSVTHHSTDPPADGCSTAPASPSSAKSRTNTMGNQCAFRNGDCASDRNERGTGPLPPSRRSWVTSREVVYFGPLSSC